MFTLQTSFNPLLLKEGGRINLLVELTVNSKEENLLTFCPNYVQEYGLWLGLVYHPSIKKNWFYKEKYCWNMTAYSFHIDTAIFNGFVVANTPSLYVCTRIADRGVVCLQGSTADTSSVSFCTGTAVCGRVCLPHPLKEAQLTHPPYLSALELPCVVGCVCPTLSRKHCSHILPIFLHWNCRVW